MTICVRKKIVYTILVDKATVTVISVGPLSLLRLAYYIKIGHSIVFLRFWPVLPRLAMRQKQT
jgi:hypothetical protein